MHNLELITKYACLSDESRWSVNGYNFDFEISDKDKDCIQNIWAVGCGELTGIGAQILMYRLLDNESQARIGDFYTAYEYFNIIVAEEFRHGMTIAQLINSSYIKEQDHRTFGNEYVKDVQNPNNWDCYGLLISLCLSECVNTQLYKCIAAKVESPELNRIFKNIMKDEARHLSAWRGIIKQLCEADPYHKNRFLESLSGSVHTHNASIGNNYWTGVKGTFNIFETDSVENIIQAKYAALSTIFGEDMPYTKRQLKGQHMRFLATSLVN
jgi:rubrerythrin